LELLALPELDDEFPTLLELSIAGRKIELAAANNVNDHPDDENAVTTNNNEQDRHCRLSVGNSSSHCQFNVQLINS